MLPARFAKFGKPCSDISDADGVTPMCDGKGIAVGLWRLLGTVDGVPPEASTTIHARDGLPRGASLHVAVEGERLWISQVTCGICARIISSAFVGWPAKLNDTQLQKIQQRLGIPQEPALRSVADWKRHYQ